MDLSIIIPCYNHGIYIRDAVASVKLYSGARQVEIIIVNDGSTDDYTKAVLQELSNEGCRVIHQENKGLGAARNTGIRNATGRYILPLDSDNKIYSDYIDKSIAVLDATPTIGVVYGDAMYFGGKAGRWIVGDFEIRKLFDFNFIDACAVYRKQIWEELGGYDENMPAMGSEDWEFWMRVAMRGWQFYYIPEVLFEYRVRGDSMVHQDTKPNYDKIVEYIFSKPEYRLAKDYRATFMELDKYHSVTYSWKALQKGLINKLFFSSYRTK
ncbi:MAG: glycosyltransferase [Saprospiraceae bacterium]|nr:glycosyltransferase [Saprospiraceae bacterium]